MYFGPEDLGRALVNQPHFPYPEPGEPYVSAYRGVSLPDLERLLDELTLGSTYGWQARPGSTYVTYSPNVAIKYADPQGAWSSPHQHGWVVRFPIPQHVEEWLTQFGQQAPNPYEVILPGTVPGDLIQEIGIVPRGFSAFYPWTSWESLDDVLDKYLTDLLSGSKTTKDFLKDDVPPPAFGNVGSWLEYLQWVREHGIPRSSFEDVLGQGLAQRAKSRVAVSPEQEVVPQVLKPLAWETVPRLRFGEKIQDPLQVGRYSQSPTLWRPFDLPGEAGMGGDVFLEELLSSPLAKRFIPEVGEALRGQAQRLKFVHPSAVRALVDVMERAQNALLTSGSAYDASPVLRDLLRPYYHLGMEGSPALRELLYSVARDAIYAAAKARAKGAP